MSVPAALEGIRALDVADHLGAYTGRLLAEMGADVVKVEAPQGDVSRRLAPFAATAAGPLALPFVHDNVGKRSIVLDLDRPDDQERFRALAEAADVVLSTATKEQWESQGINLDRLSQEFPRLVWTSITPFGLTGPYASYQGNNIVAEAMGGLMYIQGDDQKPPCMSPCEQGLHLANLHASFGTLLALRERATSGLGQLVDVSMQEVVAHVYFNLVRYAYDAEILRRPGALNPLPPNGYYRCQDGFAFISLFFPHQWDALAQWVQDPVLLNPEFRERDYRRAQGDLVDTLLEQFTLQFDRWSFTEEAQQRGIPVAPFCTLADLAANRHLEQRAFFVERDQPPLGRLRGPGAIFRASASPLVAQRPAPRLGEHQAEVLADFPRRDYKARPPAGRLRRRLPMEGVRILDLSRVWAGPYGTRYLADFGADVIKVESSKFPDSRRPNDPSYAEINRNKRPITLDFQSVQGQALLKRLVALSDVVVENFSPRVMGKQGLEYEQLRQVRPDIIMVRMPGFGLSGPHSHFASYGGPLLAYTGMGLLWAHPGSPPNALIKMAYPDYIAAATLTNAILAALRYRDRTGEGQLIEIAQVENTAALMEVAFFDYFANGVVAAPCGNRDVNHVPQGCYPCRGDDAWCVVSCATDAHWRALAALVGRPELAEDPAFATAAARRSAYDEMDGLIAAWTRQYTPHQAMRLLQRAGVPAGVVQSGEDLWRDIHMRARGYVVAIDHPEIGLTEHPGMTVRLSATPGQLRRPAGRLGQENTAVFGDLLALSEDEIAQYIAAQVIA
ncbi:MAG: CoA transferase [Chloroflexi bacterium]|nr:CoA transferase [Chloroflexota bacterium]